jgi:NADH-quinone oxidoreductase subunit A
MLTDFGVILLFFIISVLFVGAGLLTSALIRPSHPNPIKNSTYECGEEPIGGPWIKFNPRFYVIALVFLVFDVELVLLFPWAVVYKDLGWFAFIAMAVFFAILVVGLAYDWAKGYLEWDKPNPYIPKLEDLVLPKKNYKK